MKIKIKEKEKPTSKNNKKFLKDKKDNEDYEDNQNTEK